MHNSIRNVSPFERGVRSLAALLPVPNPFDGASIEYRNFELGRQHALKYRIVRVPARLDDAYAPLRS
jgi:hypothetical protein